MDVTTDVTQQSEVGGVSTEGMTTEVQLEQQQALDRYKKSTTSVDDENDEGVPDGFNPDGTPIEEGSDDGDVNWKDKYTELEVQHILATNEHAYQTDLGLFDASEIIADTIKNGSLSQEDFNELIETGLTKEQIDEAVAELLNPNNTSTVVENNKGQAFNVQKFHEELASNGKLSDASYTELEKYGFSKNDVNIYIEGQKEIANAFATSMYAIAGGEDAYTQLIDWASQNMDKATIDNYIKAVETNDRATVKSLVEYVKYKKDGSTPQDIKPVRLNGNSDSYGGVAPFSSKADWFKATSNKLYGRDAKYTKMVENRYLASRKNGSI